MSNNRRQQARQVPLSAAEHAYNQEHPSHLGKGEEQIFRNKDGTKSSRVASSTNGMPHSDTMYLGSDSDDFQRFVKGID